MDLSEEMYDLMLERLSGSLGSDDSRKLQNWLDLSEEHKKLWTEIATIWNQGRIKYQRDRELTHEQIWKNICQRYLYKRRRRVMRWRLVAVAAMLVICLGTSILGYWHLKQLPKTTTLSTLLADRPQESVMLVLSTGEKLKVDNNLLLQRQGVTVNSDSSGMLYQTCENVNADTILRCDELFVPVGGEYQLTLSDNTHIIVNAKSRLRFPVRFVGNKREIWLEGEAYLKVAPNAGRPFIVHTQKADIRVLGTEFNVFAYEEDQKTEITLVKGAVAVNVGEQQERLCPGNQLRVDHSAMTVEKVKVDVSNYIAWKDGLLRFDDISLEELMLRLGRWHNIDFEYRREDLKHRKFTGGFKKYDSLEKVLDMIGNVNDVVFEVENNRIIIDRKK